MARKYGIGLIGAGAISPSHLNAYKALAHRLRPVGIADIDTMRLHKIGQTHFIPIATTDYRKLLEREDIDIIDICTPPFTHARIVQDALEAGKYVVCEKPLAPTLEQVDHLIAFTRKYPGRLSTVFQRRYATPVQKLVRSCEEGALGQLVGGSFRRYARGSFVKESVAWGSWTGSGGGTVMTQFIHELDLMGLVYGPPVSVSATMDTLHLNIRSEDTFAATVRFANGALVSCSSATGVGKSGVSFDIVGTERLFQYSSEEAEGKKQERSARLKTLFTKGLRVAGDRINTFLNRPVRPTGDGGTHRPFFDAILSALDMEHPLPVSPEEARSAVELATAIYASALSGETVTLPLTTSSPYYSGVTDATYENRNASTNTERTVVSLKRGAL